MNRLLDPVVFSLLSASALCAQQAVAPQHFTNASGFTSESGALGDTRSPYRYLQVHDDMNGRPMTIHALSFRRDDQTTTAYAAWNVVLDVFLSTAATTATAMSTTFDANHGANKTQGLAFGIVSFPATSHGPIPRPFEFRVPLTTPFLWSGTGGLCWEMRLQSRSNTTTNLFDAVSGSSTNPSPPVTSLGRGCRATGYTGTQYVTLAGDSQPNWTGGAVNLTYTGSRMPPSSVAIMMFGTSPTSFFGVPLPFEIPDTAAAPSGACSVYNSMALAIPALTTSTGALSANLAVPATMEFNGGRVFAQAVAPDAVANPVGVVTSNSIEQNLVANYTAVPVGKVELASSLGATGTRTNNSGKVVLFD